MYLIVALNIYSSYYVTTTSFLTLTNHYEVIIAESSNEFCKHKKKRVFVFMCKIAVTVILYRATSGLSYADAHYFQIKGNLFHPVCLMSVPLHKNI